MEKLGFLINENPVKFVGVVQGFLAFVATILVAVGVTVPAGVFTAFLGFMALALNFWTQNKFTVPEYRADQYAPEPDWVPSSDFSEDEFAELFPEVEAE